jgi:predicted HTH domain antitoxin
MSLTVRLPEEVVRLFGATRAEATAFLTELVLAELYRRGEISGGYGAKVLGISKSDFIDVLAKHGVPYLDLTEKELRRELEAARARRGWAPPSPTAAP